jgi:hypothetical protein
LKQQHLLIAYENGVPKSHLNEHAGGRVLLLLLSRAVADGNGAV